MSDGEAPAPDPQNQTIETVLDLARTVFPTPTWECDPSVQGRVHALLGDISIRIDIAPMEAFVVLVDEARDRTVTDRVNITPDLHDLHGWLSFIKGRYCNPEVELLCRAGIFDDITQTAVILLRGDILLPVLPDGPKPFSEVTRFEVRPLPGRVRYCPEIIESGSMGVQHLAKLKAVAVRGEWL